LKKIALAALLAACTLIPAASNAQIVVKIGPPVAVVEHPGPPPAAGFVWIAGYHRWDGARYVWVPGRYEQPPRPHAVWVPHHWVQRHGGWVLVEGHWR
jgi:WXXGXW repeat (2 copies)